MYEDGIVHDILCDKLSGRHYHLELHCVPCNIKVISNIINSLLYIISKLEFYCLKLMKMLF